MFIVAAQVVVIMLSVMAEQEQYAWAGQSYMEDEWMADLDGMEYVEVYINPNTYTIEQLERLNEYGTYVNGTDTKMVLQLINHMGWRTTYTIYDYLFDASARNEMEATLKTLFDSITFRIDYMGIGSYDCDSWGCMGWDLSVRTQRDPDSYVFPWSVRKHFNSMGMDHHIQFRKMSHEERTERIRMLMYYGTLGLNEYASFITSVYPDMKFVYSVQAIREYLYDEWSPYWLLGMLKQRDIIMCFDYGRIHHNIATATYLDAHAPGDVLTMVGMNGGIWGPKHCLRGDHSYQFCLERYGRLHELPVDIIGMTMVHKCVDDPGRYLWQKEDETLWERWKEECLRCE
jgi:hypothetical protein